MIEIERKGAIGLIPKIISPNADPIENFAEDPIHILEDHEYALAGAIDGNVITPASMAVVESESSVCCI